MNGLYTKYLFELPIIPSVVSQILNIPINSNISSSEIEKILKVDTYLTARLLKIANSSTYSRQREIKTIKDSITLIGLNKVKALCLLIVGSEIIENKKSTFYSSFWNESISIAFISKSIAEEIGMHSISDDIFTGGILHNLGQAILYNYSNDKYDLILNKLNTHNLDDLEINEFGITSKSIAVDILNSWNFPELYIDIVKNYLKIENHSKFQRIVDIISISKLIKNEYNYQTGELFDNQLLMTYQSRINLRIEKINYFIKDYMSDLQNDPYYKMCTETVKI